MALSKPIKSSVGLGNRVLLDKMDKLRGLGISNLVSLPQMVVVGDQSAGKSSVLESLTGFHFPRSVTLCTRHATEIICRREETKNIVISIQPADPNNTEAQKFRRETKDLNAQEFAQIFVDAAKVMGIKSGSDDDSTGSAFSRDILRVEISGPNEDHLTVIDVPGMFENVTPGVTTKEDIDLVKDMVRNYIKESRTIILAVVPCTGDIANQKILTLAKEVDPEGKRTLGVLTKPDLAVEQATKAVVVNLVNGNRRDLVLGYCVVKNRGADDTSSSAEERNLKEENFFREAPWSKLPADRLGIPALKARLQHLLMDRIKSEFPKVRSDLMTMLKKNEALLENMGESRSTTEQQRVYLGRIASRFTQIKNCGLDAYYSRNKIFHEQEELRLITRIREINEAFANVVFDKGHTRNFQPPGEKDSEGSSSGDSDVESQVTIRDDLYDDEMTFVIPLVGEQELGDSILHEAYCCPDPEDDILAFIEKEYRSSRGYELGTFGGEMLPTNFKEQSKKWSPMARAHVSNAILIVHHFIRSVLDACCLDNTIRDELWNFIVDDLQERYRRAVDHTEFLLEVEFEGKSITYSPAFNKKLHVTKFAHVEELGKQIELTISTCESGVHAAGREAREMVEKGFGESDDLASTCRNIHDVLHTFYDFARTRFVDVVCQQVIDHFLLYSPNGPLTVLSEELILHMTPENLEAIAGEEMCSRDRREKLTLDIANLKEALKILRG
ncbi:hypothetical protein NCS57_01017200 [Fusarium keratoplasticum]|uniref:Uncharacterized protein n=1 Tax=Fusarium keratoplasticum TaxID=1328300 RepID=A0ACC0QM71_9HYPO|nr:hypothetical protein NCS57_01017200 [Fusarium keratoplasticum]KAI8660400.1 hypothetical protein NCS57_01017200 [Fusarium keratoplasticum]